MKNALWVEKNIASAITLPETSLISLRKTLQQLLTSEKLFKMKSALVQFKAERKERKELAEVVMNLLNREGI